MKKSTKQKSNRKTQIKFAVCSIVFIMLAIFLSLPLLFQENLDKEISFSAEKAALPLKTENPFTHYFELFKKFYGPNREKKTFTKENLPLLAKNTTKQAIYQEESDPVIKQEQVEQKDKTKKDYYAYEEEENSQLLNFLDETEKPFVEQKPFEDIAITGLYETSQTDPYEVKQAARKTLFGIFAPRRLPFITAHQQNSALFNKPNFTPSIAEPIQPKNTPVNQTQAQGSNYWDNTNNYHHGPLESFKYNNQINDSLAFEGLSFDEQIKLVAGKLNSMREQSSVVNSNTGYNAPHGNSQQNQSGSNVKPPLPPTPQKDTFDPSKWDTKILGSCSQDEIQNEDQPSQEQEPAAVKEPDTKIDTCDPFLNEKLKPVDTKMQQEHTYLIVSGRYKGKIMIPAYLSLPQRVLTSMASDNMGIATLNMPKELRGNTEKTQFNFVSALKPQAFEQIMKDEKTILLTVDEADLERFPQKAILIQSGEIETYSGANKIIQEINKFPSKLEELKKAQQIKAEEDKTKKENDLKKQLEKNL